MKNIKIILSVLSLSVMLSSCSDARDIGSVDSILAENAFQSIDNIQQGLNRAYLRYSPENLLSLDLYTDDYRIGSQSGGQNLIELRQELNIGSAVPNAIWLGRYRMITEISTFLPFAENFPAANQIEQDRLNRIIGESLTLRALGHLDLMLLFASGTSVSDFDVYAGTNLAVPITTNSDVARLPTRSTVSEVAEFITSELDRASSLLGNPTDNDFLTQQAITAIRARLALYTGNYADAINQANVLINQFPLANTTQYFDMFRTDTDETEVIWSLIRNQAAGGSPGGIFFFTNTRGPHTEVSNEMANLVPMGTTDVRRSVVLDLTTSQPGETRVGKYFGRPGENGRNNIKVFRVSEQYLIRAEAQARLGNLVGAAASVSALLDARFGTPQPVPVYNNLQEAIVDILEQRRIELFAEGHRYIDLRRTRDITGEGITKDGTLGIPGVSDDCGSRGVNCSGIPINDQRFAMPIPVNELNGNPDITQNPGY